MAEAGTQVSATVTQVGGGELFLNTTFEVDANNWESNTNGGEYAAATLARSSTQAHGGSWSLRVTVPAGVDGVTKKTVANHALLTGLTVGRAYNFSAWVYVPTGGPDVYPVVLSGKRFAPVTAKNQWTLAQATFVATATSHRVGFDTGPQPATAATVWYLDDASMRAPFAITVDGATTPCPAAIAQGSEEAAPVFYVNDRVTVTIRNPAVPLVEGVESTDPPSSDPAAGYVSPMCGQIVMTGRTSVPDSNWLMCDGAAVSRTTYKALFSVIGTTYGAGNGSTTFNVPNFTGKFPRQATPGVTGGSETYALGSHGHTTTSDSHSHSGPSHEHSISDNIHDHGNTDGPSGGVTRASGTLDTSGNGHVHNIPDNSHNHSGTTGFAGSGSTSSDAHSHSVNSGGGATVDTVPPYLGVNFMIRVF